MVGLRAVAGTGLEVIASLFSATLPSKLRYQERLRTVANILYWNLFSSSAGSTEILIQEI
jgi:hypothetical protein